MRPALRLALGFAFALFLLAASAAAQPRRVIEPGERLKIGLAGQVFGGEGLWLMWRVQADGAVELPTNARVVVAGLTRGEAEAMLAGRYAATFCVISRLERGEDHGGKVTREVEPPDPETIFLDRAFAAVEVPFDIVVSDLRQRANVPLHVNYAALEFEGVERTTEVSVNVPAGVTLATALELVLDSASGGFAELNWEVKDEVVHLSTEDDLSRYVVSRLYDVRDLCREYRGERTHSATVEHLMEIVMSEVRVDTWKDNGGTIGSIDHLNGRFLIATTPRIHRQIATLFAKLRAGVGQPSVQID